MSSGFDTELQKAMKVWIEVPSTVPLWGIVYPFIALMSKRAVEFTTPGSKGEFITHLVLPSLSCKSDFTISKSCKQHLSHYSVGPQEIKILPPVLEETSFIYI